MTGTNKNSGPKKSFGQHWLIDQSVIDQIIGASDLDQFSHLVEIGPGRGALTGALKTHIDTLDPSHQPQGALVELDPDLYVHLETNFSNFRLVKADATQIDWSNFFAAKPNRWILLGNLPYNVGTAIIMNALKSSNPPDRCVVMLQREVGERFLAQAPQMSLLSVASQLYASVTSVCIVKPQAFNPPPQVDSIVIKLDRLAPSLRHPDPESVINLAKVGFSHPRKQLASVLSNAGVIDKKIIGDWLVTRGLPITARPQELSVDDWVALKSRIDAKKIR